jgi:dephospho-CoA kinase
MVRVALTGGIATGKSYVRAGFDRLGIPTIDADVLAREVVAPGSPGLAALVARFGNGVLDSAGRLDRARLGGLVFTDTEARRALEAIVHPRVYAAIDGWFATLTEQGEALGVADIPLLFETHHVDDFDVVVVTYCPRDVQLARIQARDGASAAAARQRLAAQWPIDEKVPRADYVIRTDGSFAETDAQVAEVAARLRAHAARASALP